MSQVGCPELGATLWDAEADVTGAYDIELPRLRTNQNRIIGQLGRILSFLPTTSSLESVAGWEARAEKHGCLRSALSMKLMQRNAAKSTVRAERFGVG